MDIIGNQCNLEDFNIMKSLTMGALAGGVRGLSRSLAYPFDTKKTWAQAGVRDTENMNLFKGLFVTVIAAIPANAIFFLSDSALTLYFTCSTLSISPIFTKLLASTLATAPLVAIKIPAERVKQVSQVNSLTVIENIDLISQGGIQR